MSTPSVSGPKPRRSSTGEVSSALVKAVITAAIQKANSKTSLMDTDAQPPASLQSGKRRLVTDSDGFQTFLKQPRQGNSALKKPRQSTVAPIPVANRFAPIANPSTSSQNPPASEPKPRRPPPLILDSTLYSTSLLANRLRGLSIKDFRVQSTARSLKVFLQTEEDYEKTKSYFLLSHQTETPVSFYTFAPRGSKPNKKFLILGLDEAHPIDSIQAALQHPDLIDVRRLTSTVDGVRVETPNVLVTFKPDYKYEQHLKLIRAIDNVMVRHKPFLNNQGTPTCQRCLALGHTKRYCWRPPRCVRCSGNHPVQECNPEIPPKCSNCGGDHPASFRQCPHRLRILATKARTGKPTQATTVPTQIPRNPPPPPPSVWAIPSHTTPDLSGHYPSLPASKILFPSHAAPTQPLPPTQPHLPDPNTTPPWVTELTTTLTGMIQTLIATVNSLIATHPKMVAK